MGFEIVYYFHEKLEEGGYDKEETKEMKKRVGKPYDDISLNQVAVSILGQLARRDIWVTDVEIYEYKKSKINFRETKGGIVIKNKKFSYDTPTSGEVSLVEEEIQEGQKPNQNALVLTNNGVPLAQRRVVKQVVLDTSHDILNFKREQKGIKFTPGKKYPVYKIREGIQIGTYVYSMVDDFGREIDVSDEYWCNPDVKYVNDSRGENSFEGPPREEAPRLLYQGEESAGMPDISNLRRR